MTALRATAWSLVAAFLGGAVCYACLLRAELGPISLVWGAAVALIVVVVAVSAPPRDLPVCAMLGAVFALCLLGWPIAIQLVALAVGPAAG